MDLDLSTAAFGVHAAVGALFFALAASNVTSGNLVPATLQSAMGLLLVGLGVAVYRVVDDL